MKMTDKQLKCLCWHLWQAEQNELIEQGIGEGEIWLKENIDLGTASNLIGLFSEDKPELALAQLNHLGAKFNIYAR